ncbi:MULTISPECIES: hypothetical protein [unclassified Microbacterium]|uniref:hypothetical protein n=1 Tax=unclassified Microbacterium TaxID=2609290 RepID=UPI003010033D
MYVSPEIFAVVLSAVGVVVTFGVAMVAGFGWCVRRIDAAVARLEHRVDARIDALDERLTARIDAVEEKLTARIDAVEEKLTARIDAVEEKLTARIDALENRLTTETTDLRVAIARIEGTPRRLLTTH